LTLERVSDKSKKPNMKKNSDIYIFGNKDNFAVQSQILFLGNTQPLEKVQIWFKGISVGWFEDINLLSITNNQLNFLKNRLEENYIPNDDKFYNFIKQLSKKNLTKTLSDDNTNFFKISNLGEAFDDFGIFNTLLKNSIGFVWYLGKYGKIRLPGYRHKIQYHIIEKSFFIDVVDSYTLAIEKYWK